MYKILTLALLAHTVLLFGAHLDGVNRSLKDQQTSMMNWPTLALQNKQHKQETRQAAEHAVRQVLDECIRRALEESHRKVQK